MKGVTRARWSIALWLGRGHLGFLVLLALLLLAGAYWGFACGLLVHNEASVALLTVPLETSEVGLVELIISLRTIWLVD